MDSDSLRHQRLEAKILAEAKLGAARSQYERAQSAAGFSPTADGLRELDQAKANLFEAAHRADAAGNALDAMESRSQTPDSSQESALRQAVQDQFSQEQTGTEWAFAKDEGASTFSAGGRSARKVCHWQLCPYLC